MRKRSSPCSRTRRQIAESKEAWDQNKTTDDPRIATDSLRDGSAAPVIRAHGTATATYTYVANSRLVGQVAFEQSGSPQMHTTRAYDDLNRLQSITSTPASGLPLTFGYQHNSANQRTRTTLADGSFWIYSYDELGQVTSGKRYWSDGSPVPGEQFEYGFDDIGNRETTRAGGDGVGANLRGAAYNANSLNQYTNRTVPGYIQVLGHAAVGAAVTVNGSGVSYRRGEFFHKELSVNNSSAAVNLGVAVIAAEGGLTSTNAGAYFVPKNAEVFLHDADGNQTNDGRWSFTWDAENRLVKMESLSTAPTASRRRLEFEYDDRGRRIWKKSTNLETGGVTERKFLYDGWNVVAELDGANNLVQSYAWGLDLSGTESGAGGVGGLLVVKPLSANPQFAAYDGNGNVAGLLDGNTGTWTAHYEYGPFGAPIRVSGAQAKANPFRWSTKYTDDESGLVYYGYRYYNPSTARWISRDAIAEKGGLNLYKFVDPINQIDILGMIESAQHFVWHDFPIEPEPARGVLFGLTWSTYDGGRYSQPPKHRTALSGIDGCWRVHVFAEWGARGWFDLSDRKHLEHEETHYDLIRRAWNDFVWNVEIFDRRGMKKEAALCYKDLVPLIAEAADHESLWLNANFDCNSYEDSIRCNTAKSESQKSIDTWKKVKDGLRKCANLE